MIETFAPPAGAPKPRVRRARTSPNAAQGKRNWVLSFGTLRLTYSSHPAAYAAATVLAMFGLISPVGLVGMHRELEADG